MTTPSAEFQDLIRQHGDTAYRMAYQLTGGREAESADLVQEVFIRIWKRWSAPRPQSIKGWMYRVLRNLYIDSARYRKRHPALSIHEERDGMISLEERLPDAQPTASHVLEQKDVQRDVQQALKQLSEEFRTPIVLCDIEGLRYEDIARILDCPIGTVRSRIHRGRLELRRLLHAHKPLEVSR